MQIMPVPNRPRKMGANTGHFRYVAFSPCLEFSIRTLIPAPVSAGQFSRLVFSPRDRRARVIARVCACLTHRLSPLCLRSSDVR